MLTKQEFEHIKEECPWCKMYEHGIYRICITGKTCRWVGCPIIFWLEKIGVAKVKEEATC